MSNLVVSPLEEQRRKGEVEQAHEGIVWGREASQGSICNNAFPLILTPPPNIKYYQYVIIYNMMGVFTIRRCAEV